MRVTGLAMGSYNMMGKLHWYLCWFLMKMFLLDTSFKMT